MTKKAPNRCEGCNSDFKIEDSQIWWHGKRICAKCYGRLKYGKYKFKELRENKFSMNSQK